MLLKIRARRMEKIFAENIFALACSKKIFDLRTRGEIITQQTKTNLRNARKIFCR